MTSKGVLGAEPLPLEEVRKYFSYNPETGEIRWVSRVRSHFPNRRAGCPMPDGRRVVILRGKRMYTSRLAWFLTYGQWPMQRVDHIDGNPGNDALSNLRLATASQNSANHHHRNKWHNPAYPGASFKPYSRPASRPWIAQIYVGGKRKHLGCFASAAEASDVYKAAHLQVYGEFSPYKKDSNQALQRAGKEA